MATTSKGIVYPVGTDAVTPLHTVFANLATSTDTAIGNIKMPGHYTGTNAQRTALIAPDLREGIFWYATDTNLMWFYNGSAWKMQSSRPMGVKVYKNVAQSWTTAPTAVTWNSTGANFDTDSFYTSASNTRITVPYAGLYQISWSMISSGVIATTTTLYVNGVTTSVFVSATGASGAGTNPQATVTMNLASGDYLQVFMDSASTGAGTWHTGNGCWFECFYIGQI